VFNWVIRRFVERGIIERRLREIGWYTCSHKPTAAVAAVAIDAATVDVIALGRDIFNRPEWQELDLTKYCK